MEFALLEQRCHGFVVKQKVSDGQGIVIVMNESEYERGNLNAKIMLAHSIDNLLIMFVISFTYQSHKICSVRVVQQKK